MDLDWFDDQDAIIEAMKDKAPSSRKTTFAALIAITAKDNEKYKAALLDDSKVYDKFIKSQKKSESQGDNWKDYDQIKTIYESMFAKVKPLLNSKEPLDYFDYKKLQDFIALSLTSGYWVPPRRSTDWTEFKIRNINKAEDNYMDKNEFVFNKYKTAKFYNTQRVEIPKGLKIILSKFIKLNPNEYLLTNSSGGKLNNVRLTQMLNKIFGNRISTSLLRHIYLTDRLKDVPKLDELNTLATDMGHSLKEQLEYVKH
jgi:ribosomal protein S18